ncbi:uncharacterized protein F5Z01DRAFT_750512 [Emericellopsis atlantica]|uniref:Uncharacterized protein n=1 Tax=Emericellopsis atlantica TaxID=2614577 RepID=A0A9P7ZLT1_9HYPO|nr:uncharacterized protein F5Z01DRAFT_750512 [Emericellopsis atlantica]KAG9254057.1 hypothetical protein F5Z01DRAFT_750512 [Emericellopsis atlantica]
MNSSILEAKDKAAAAVTPILEQHGIRHAYIGGYAVNVLGHDRQTDDIDILIDIENDKPALQNMAQLLLDADTRFSLVTYKLTFTCGTHRIPIETLPTGELGLPREIKTIQVGEHMIPILQPDILILTKIKRCVHYIGSTRPRSIRKFEFDLFDIVFLLGWLKSHNQTVDFDAYNTPDENRGRLYAAVKDLADYWQDDAYSEEMELLQATLSQKDREILKV